MVKLLSGLISVFFVLFVINPVWAEAPPTQNIDSFSYQATLSDANSSLRQVALPLSIYEKLTRKDHGDLRVFNNDNQVVPHQFVQANRVDTQQERVLKFYPFSKEQAANPNNIRVMISQKSGHQHLEINQQLRGSGLPDLPKALNEFQYIILNEKNEEAKQTLCQLKLDWDQIKPSMILPLALESSNDLQSWHTLSRSLNVSKLNFSGSQLLNKELNFPCTRAKYLRLTWLKPKQQNHINKISGVYTRQGEKTTESAVLSKPYYNENGHLLFENPLNIALSAMEFVSLQDSLLIKGRLFSRNDEASPWRFHQNILQYRLLIAEAKLSSRPFSIPYNNSDRYWKLELANEGQLSANQLPEIHGSWYQKKLVYLAQGKGPFKLAYGNPAIKPAHNNGLVQLIQSVNDSGSELDQVEVSNPHKVRELAKVEKKLPWKQIGLWALLLIGTGVLGYMAWSLYRQMGTNKE